MGYRELMEALSLEGEERIAALRREGEAEEERLRGEAAERLRLRGEEYARRTRGACAEASREILAAAEREGALLRLAAEAALAERLLAVARGSLTLLGEGESRELFGFLARELPPVPWERVRVNPADEEEARRLFPGVEVVVDPSLAGGLETVGAGGGLRVDNTLEKRLERGWPELLPRLAADVRREVGDERDAPHP